LDAVGVGCGWSRLKLGLFYAEAQGCFRVRVRPTEVCFGLRVGQTEKAFRVAVGGRGLRVEGLGLGSVLR
jgi:hypothetical protein